MFCCMNNFFFTVFKLRYSYKFVKFDFLFFLQWLDNVQRLDLDF